MTVFQVATVTIFRREFQSYFETPLAYVFLVLFLLVQGLFTFYLGQFFAREQADLSAFFAYHPWLYLFFVPAIAMRLWAEEGRRGTLELLLTLPLPLPAVVLGKYLAALAFTGVALLLTLPLWLTVNWLGSPDNGIILVSYLGSFLLAATYLALGCALSAVSHNQVIAFVLAASASFLLTVAGLPLVQGFFSGWAGETVSLFLAELAFLAHYDSFQKGLIALNDVFYFLVMTGFFLTLNVILVSRKREAG